MKRSYYIGADTHCKETELVVVTQTGRISKRMRCPTTIPALLEFVKTIPRPRHLAFEEGPLADWLYRNLLPWTDQVVVCDPRRNQMIAKEGDHDDPIDAEKLAQLFRGGYVKAVHHSESLDRSVFKHHVGLYHDRMGHRVEEANRIMAYLRHYGIFVRERDFAEADSRDRQEILKQLPGHPIVRSDLLLLWKGYDAAVAQVDRLRRQLIQMARREPAIRRFVEIPGIQWIRAATFFVYIDTPWRFKSKSALWRYMGIGLERWRSGNGPEQVRVPPSVAVNRPLKSMILGAAKSAVASKDNEFADAYERWINRKITPRNALRNVARSQAMALWGMWKNGDVYRPERISGAAAWTQEEPSVEDRRIMRGRRSSPGGIGPRDFAGVPAHE
jgi:transposase